MEQQLQPSQALEPSTVLTDKHIGRTTRGLNLSIKYTELLSRNRRESIQEAEPSAMENEVLCLCIFSKCSLCWHGEVIRLREKAATWCHGEGLPNLRIKLQAQSRFPAEEFLKALDVVDPREWATARDPSFYVSKFSVYLTLTQRMETYSHLSSKVQSIRESISRSSSCGHYSWPIWKLSCRQIRVCEEHEWGTVYGLHH